MRGINLVGARIVGQLDLRHARIRYPMVLKDCYFDEPVDLSHADAVFVSFEGSYLQTLTCQGIRIRGDLCCACISVGHVDAFGCHIEGCFWVNGAELRGGSETYALTAPDMTVEGGMYCRGLQSAAGINLYGVAIGSTLEIDRATIEGSDGTAVRAPGLTVKLDLRCVDARVTGGIDLFGAHIGGQVWLNGSHLSQGKGGQHALSLPVAEVAGGVYCNGSFRSEGTINLFGASIGSTLEFDGASLSDPGGIALRGSGLTVKAGINFTGGFAVDGALDLSGACINGQLEFGSSTYTGTELNLSQARVQALSGRPDFWPERIRFNELTYTALEPYLPAAQWIAWLRRNPGGYQPQPYEQLAASYRRLGHDEQARTVRLSKERHRREGLGLPGKAWGYLQDAAVGYGYRPARALAWLIVLVALTAAYFAANPPHPVNTTHGPHFQAVIYAVDVAVPILDLGQQRVFAASGAGQWISWLVTLAGWILATTVIAGITRVLTRN